MVTKKLIAYNIKENSNGDKVAVYLLSKTGTKDTFRISLVMSKVFFTWYIYK